MSLSKRFSYRDRCINKCLLGVGVDVESACQAIKTIWREKQFNHQKKCLKFFSKISFAVFQKQIAIRELRRLILHPAPEIVEMVLKIGIDKL